MSKGTIFILLMCGLMLLLALGVSKVVKERPPEPKRKKIRKRGEIKIERSLEK